MLPITKQGMTTGIGYYETVEISISTRIKAKGIFTNIVQNELGDM